MISTLDHGIGQIVSALEEEELLRSNRNIFTSDNGGFSPAPWFVELLIPPMRDGLADNSPLLGGKELRLTRWSEGAGRSLVGR